MPAAGARRDASTHLAVPDDLVAGFVAAAVDEAGYEVVGDGEVR